MEGTTMMKRLAVVVGLLLAGAAGAQDSAPVVPIAPARPMTTGYQTHDGFYLNLGLGFGALNSEGGGLKLEGTGPGLNLALGGAMNRNLLIGGRIFSVSAQDPKVTIDGFGSGTASGSNNLVGYGFDLLYYTDENFYFGVSPALTRLSFTADNGGTGNTDVGFGLRLAAGKEWWVSDNWGLGLNLEFVHASNKDSGSDVTISSNWFGVAFSATFN
jgi:opacity protein-like surface antigen